MVSAIDLAKRALVGLLKTIAAAYGVVENISRDSPDEDLRSAYRRILRRAHPDHGGDAEHQKSLNNAIGAWEEALKASRGRGGDQRKSGNSSDGATQVPSGLPTSNSDPKEGGKIRFQSLGILLTYQKFDDEACWKRFVTYVEGQIPAHSPDLNPIESFWSWLKKELRRRDLEDLRQKQPPLGKTAYKQRVKSILKGKKAQKAARAKFANFRKVCK